MKTLLALGLLLFSVSSFAWPTNALLVCNLSFGPDQQVLVRTTANGLILEELTDTGSTKRRPLSEKEFKSQTLQLRIGEPYDSGTLTLQADGNWLYNLGGAVGYASCATAL